jgi:hypothetical protein
MWYDGDHLASLLQFDWLNSKLLFNHWPEAAGQVDTYSVNPIHLRKMHCIALNQDNHCRASQIQPRAGCQ